MSFDPMGFDPRSFDPMSVNPFLLGNPISPIELKIFSRQIRLENLQMLTTCCSKKEKPKSTAWAGRRSQGTIVLLREQTELSRSMPLFRKKERTHRTCSKKYRSDL